MKHPICPLLIATVLLACQRASAVPESAGAPIECPSPTPAVDPALAAQQALDTMDTRAPVPLLPRMAHHQKQNMRDHLVAVQEVVTAMTTDDFAAIERAAARIGFSEQMGQTCTHMGAGAPGFTELALNFHHTADAIAAAARQGDRVAVTAALGTTLQTCTSCHAAFRQSVVDDAAWDRLASMPARGEAGP